MSNNILSHPKTGWVVAGALAVLGGFELVRLICLFWDCIVIDDAFITFRYAQNWAEGWGPVWNRGEPPVEGYSAPLQMALLAGAQRLFGVDIPLFSRLVGILWTLGTLLGLMLLVRRTTDSPAWGWAAAGILALDPCIAIWAVGGLETALYVFLGLLSVLAVDTVRQRPRWGTWVALGSALLGLALVRTEGLVFTAAFAGAWLLTAPDKSARLQGWLTLMAVGALYAIFLLVRHRYYGLWLPVPVFAKRGVLLGLSTVRRFVEAYWMYLALGAVAFYRLRHSALRPTLVYCVLAGGVLVGVVVNASAVRSDHQRYVLPLLPILVWVGVLGLRELLVLRPGWTPAICLGAALTIAVVPRAHLSVGQRRGQIERTFAYSDAMKRSHLPLAQWLKEHVPDRQAQVAAVDSGVLPYFSGLRFIDLYGLNDLWLAKHKRDLNYVFGKSPEFVIVSAMSMDDDLRTAPQMSRYSPVGTWQGLYELVLYKRNDYPLPSAPQVD